MLDFCVWSLIEHVNTAGQVKDGLRPHSVESGNWVTPEVGHDGVGSCCASREPVNARALRVQAPAQDRADEAVGASHDASLHDWNYSRISSRAVPEDAAARRVVGGVGFEPTTSRV